MKLTTKKLKKLIEEELKSLLDESEAEKAALRSEIAALESELSDIRQRADSMATRPGIGTDYTQADIMFGQLGGYSVQRRLSQARRELRSLG